MSGFRKGYLTRIGLLVCAFIFTAEFCFGAEIAGIITDTENRPVDDAVISVTRENLRAAAAPESRRTEIMDQVKSQFQPHVLVVQKGTYVSFPNSDNFRHHVYSFSKSKRFEIKLYAGMPQNKIQFEKTGVVAVGCNIHDWMLGYIYVVDTPYFIKTGDDGRFQLKNVPDGNYLVQIWHPRLKEKMEEYNRYIMFQAGKPVELNLTIPLKRKRIRKRSKY